MVTAGQLFAAMMVPTALMLLGIILDAIAWRRLHASLDASLDRLENLVEMMKR